MGEILLDSLAGVPLATLIGTSIGIKPKGYEERRLVLNFILPRENRLLVFHISAMHSYLTVELALTLAFRGLWSPASKPHSIGTKIA